MAVETYDRYDLFRNEGKIEMVPSVSIPKKSTDYFEIYKLGQSRLDIISNNYYGNPNYDWLIMMANPEFGSMEFEIPDGSELRIPYPLDITIRNYIDAVNLHKQLY